MIQSHPLILAALVAPLVAVLVVYAVGLLTFLILGAESVPLGAPLHVAFFTFLFGAPIAYVVEGMVGIPAYRWFQARGRFSAAPIVLIGTVTGAVGVPLIWAAFWGRAGLGWSHALFGAVAGGTAALVFWLVAFGRRRHAAAA